MIQAGLAAPRRAAQVTALVLGAAALRALLLPAGDGISTAIFATCLLGISFVYALPRPPHKGEGNPGGLSHKGEGVLGADQDADVRWGRGASLLVGLAVGAILLAPGIAGPLTTRPLASFWSWAAIAAIVATLEETAIRGVLYRTWQGEAGPVGAVVAGAIVFALIHLPRYGFAAMPLDLAVGLALGGLRALTGRVFPCAVAHTIADWGAWFCA